MEDYILNIQVKVVELLHTISDDLSVASEDRCSEMARLVGCWLLDANPALEIDIFKGQISDTVAHDVLFVAEKEINYIIDSTIWQIFPKAESIMVGTAGNTGDALSMMKNKYGGFWKISEHLIKCAPDYKKELFNIIKK